MLEFFKNSGFTVMPLENENKKKGIFSTLGSYAASAVRIPIGLTLGVAIAAVSFVRATIGTGANFLQAGAGAVGVLGSLVVAGVSFGCIRAVDGTRSLLGLEPLKDRGVLLGINSFHNACKEYTGSKWQAAQNSFNNVFTGKQDKKYKQSISNFLKRFKKPAPVQSEVNDERGSVSTQRSTDSEDRTSFSGLGNDPDHMNVSYSRSTSVDQRRGSRNTSVDQDRESLLSRGAAEDKKKKYDSILSEFSNTGKALTASVQLFLGKRRSKRNEANERRNR